MIQKEQFKERRERLEHLLSILNIPRYVWYWPELLFNTLLLMTTLFLPQQSLRRKMAFEAMRITEEIYK